MEAAFGKQVLVQRLQFLCRGGVGGEVFGDVAAHPVELAEVGVDIHFLVVQPGHQQAGPEQVRLVIALGEDLLQFLQGAAFMQGCGGEPQVPGLAFQFPGAIPHRIEWPLRPLWQAPRRQSARLRVAPLVRQLLFEFPDQVFRLSRCLPVGPTDAEIPELGDCRTEFGQTHPARGEPDVGRFDDALAIDETFQTPGFEVDPQFIPLARAIVFRLHLGQHRPGIDIGTQEAGQPQPASGGVEAVMPVATVRTERQPGRPLFILIVLSPLYARLPGAVSC